MILDSVKIFELEINHTTTYDDFKSIFLSVVGSADQEEGEDHLSLPPYNSRDRFITTILVKKKQYILFGCHLFF